MSYAFSGSAPKRRLVKSRQISLSYCLQASCVAAAFLFVTAAVFLL
ncbi:hypothetical protein HGO38_15905 [Rhizobium sp. CG5]|nr:hypothetical protein [Rhizobium sp. CG5]MCM2474966.1 hypothetical protein [Rhizobium sp. CG5]